MLIFLSSLLISWTIIIDILWTGNTVDYWRKDVGINSNDSEEVKSDMTDEERKIHYITQYAKYFLILFIIELVLLILNIITSVIDVEIISSFIPQVVNVVLTIIESIILIINGLVLFFISKYIDEYRKVAILQWILCLISIILYFTKNTIIDMEITYIIYTCAIVTLIINIVKNCFEFSAHSYATFRIDPDLSETWDDIKKWYLYFFGAIVVSAIMLIIIPIIGIICAICCVIYIIVLKCKILLALLNTAKLFMSVRNLQKLPSQDDK